jgi:Ca-activated chloride channel family protein
MRIAYPELWWLALLPLSALILMGYASWRRAQITRLIGEARLVQLLTTSLSLEKRIIKLTLILLGMGALVCAALRPQFGQRAEMQVQSGIDIAVAFDVSKSMLVQDIPPSRLGAAQALLRQLVNRLSSHRLALVPFAGIAFTQSPLTADKSAFRLFLKGLDPRQMTRGGTDIAAAIKEGVNRLSGASDRGDKRSRSRVLLLITDGENLGRGSASNSKDGAAPTSQLTPEIREAVEEANQQRVVIYAVAVGTAFGDPIPIVDKEGKHQGYKRKEGTQELIYSKLNSALLEEIVELNMPTQASQDPSQSAVQEPAQELGDMKSIQRVFQLDGQREVLNEIENSLSRLKKYEFQSMIRESNDEKYVYALIPALLLLWLELLISDQRKMHSAQSASTKKRRKNASTSAQEELS